jgi:hypothetical protein
MKSCNAECKWIDHCRDVRPFSRQFQNIARSRERAHFFVTCAHARMQDAHHHMAWRREQYLISRWQTSVLSRVYKAVIYDNSRPTNARTFLTARNRYLISCTRSCGIGQSSRERACRRRTGFSSQPQVHIWNDADILSAREIRKLTSEIRKEIQTIANLTTMLRNLGH